MIRNVAQKFFLCPAKATDLKSEMCKKSWSAPFNSATISANGTGLLLQPFARSGCCLHCDILIYGVLVTCLGNICENRYQKKRMLRLEMLEKNLAKKMKVVSE